MKDLQLSDVLTDANFFEAWAKVCANQGCAGIDGVSITDFQRDLLRNFTTLRNEVNYDTYRPSSLMRVEIEKKDSDSKRPLSIPIVRDRLLQTAVALQLTPIFEAEFEDCSFAYRKGRSVDQAVRQVMRLHGEGYCWVVDADIHAFFDEIDRDLLMVEIEKLVKDVGILKLIRLWLNVDVIDGKQRFWPKKGVPQGSPISPLLSNLYLDHLDEAFFGKSMRLVRFADDFLVLCKSRAKAEEALELTSEVLEQLQLQINEKKTQIVDFNRGFRFLGVKFVRSLVYKAQFPVEKSDSRSLAAMPVKEVLPKNRVEQFEVISSPTAIENTLRAAFSEASIEAKDFPSPAEEPEEIEPLVEDIREDDLPADHDPRLRTLYLLEHGYTLGKESERLVVRRQDEIIKEVPVIKVDQIMVFGNAQISTQAMQLCLRERIPIYLLSTRGRYHGAIDAFDTDPVLLHRDQFVRAADAGFCLSLAREFVRGKIANCRVVLRRYARTRNASALQQAVSDLKSVRLDDAQTLDQLRGFEGSAARIYFTAISRTVDAG